MELEGGGRGRYLCVYRLFPGLCTVLWSLTLAFMAILLWVIQIAYYLKECTECQVWVPWWDILACNYNIFPLGCADFFYPGLGCFLSCSQPFCKFPTAQSFVPVLWCPQVLIVSLAVLKDLAHCTNFDVHTPAQIQDLHASATLTLQYNHALRTAWGNFMIPKKARVSGKFVSDNFVWCMIF